MNDSMISDPSELDALARSIADRLLARGPEAAQRLDTQMERYAAGKSELAERPPVVPAADPKPAPGVNFKRERAEWRRLECDVHAQARAVADRLLEQRPSAVAHLGPQMERYAVVQKELGQLSYRIARTHSQSPTSPAW